MFDAKRPLWKSGFLHLVLIAGSLAFALPYLWLVGTSWKLDKEIQTDEITIFPQRPIPRTQSPYVDERHFPDVERPEQVPIGRWDDWLHEAAVGEIHRCLTRWKDARAGATDVEVLRDTLTKGIFRRLKTLLPPGAWQNDDEAAFRNRISEAVTADMVAEIFEQCYRRLTIGQVQAKTQDYRIFNLTGSAPASAVWRTVSGPVEIEDFIEAQRPVGILAYNFAKESTFELAAELELPFPLGDLKRLILNVKRDLTWHELRVYVEWGGELLESSEPWYLGEETWSEVNFQKPSADDKRLIPKRYILLKTIAKDPKYDHGPNKIRVRVNVAKSSVPEAFWAKGTENYRRTFTEVPFWRYLATSLFLVIANVAGTLFSCSLVAFAFARLNWPGRDLCFVLVLATLMIPPQITMIPSFVIYRWLGWYNTLFPLWAPNLLGVNAFAVFLMRQFMLGIPKDLEDAAKIDGCGFWRIYTTVALPLVKPTLAALGIFTFMATWNDFLTPLIYINDQRLYPLSLGLFSFMAGRENQFTLIMAGSMIMTVPVILIFFFAQKYFIQGVTLTGVKG